MSVPFNQRVTTTVLVKAGATILRYWHVVNTTAAEAFIQVFDARQTADVTLGTTAPNFTIPLAANGESDINLGDNGTPFLNGIVIASTTSSSGSSTAASDVLMGTST